MDTLITPSNITFVIGVIGILFGVYHYFRNPQIKSDKTDALMAQTIKTEKESTEKKFDATDHRIDEVLKTAQNHIHTVDVKVDGLAKDVKLMGNEIVKLATIIHERIPKK